MGKSCFNCQHARVFPGTPDRFYMPNGDPGEPGEPPYAECNCEEDGFPSHVLDAFSDLDRDHTPLDEILPSLCGHYLPVLVGKCGNCQKPIHEPVATWQLYALCWDDTPVCSPYCLCALMKCPDGYDEEGNW